MWKDAYLIGVEQIDQQHKMLIRTLENLLKRCEQGEAKEGCKQAIAFMKGYAVNHFHAEELFQQSISFPFAQQHHRLHETFKVTLHEMDMDLLRSDYSDEKIQEIVTFLTRWWIYHIVREDKKMIKYL
jgi:hemerythrin